MHIFNRNKEYILLFTLYFISNIFLLLNIDGIYWDDWTLYAKSYDALYSQFSQNSGVLGIVFTKMHYALLNLGNGVFPYRVLTFLLYFLTGIFLFKILRTLKYLDKEAIFFITLIFLIAPLNSARITLIVFPYILGLTIFFFSFFLLSKNLKKQNKVLRMIILVLFFISFSVNSLLVFYALVLSYIFYITYMKGGNCLEKNIRKFILQNIDFILLPVFFFIIKSIYFVPSGLYQGYNSLGLISLIRAPIGLAASFFSSLIEPINDSFSLFSYFWVIILILFLITKDDNKVTVYKHHDLRWLQMGIVFFLLGTFAYVAVGKLPHSYDFESRHQLLLPLGFSFIIYFSIQILASKLSLSMYMRKNILFIFIIAFISQNIYVNYKYKIDWFYQVSLEENMKSSKLIKEHTTFVVDMDLENHLANERTISFYEHNNRLQKVFHSDNRLMINKSDNFNNIKIYRDYKQYGFGSWIYEKPIYLKIYNKEQSFVNMLKIFTYEFINRKQFRILVKDLLVIKESTDD